MTSPTTSADAVESLRDLRGRLLGVYASAEQLEGFRAALDQEKNDGR